MPAERGDVPVIKERYLAGDMGVKNVDAALPPPFLKRTRIPPDTNWYQIDSKEGTAGLIEIHSNPVATYCFPLLFTYFCTIALLHSIFTQLGGGGGGGV